MADWLLDLVGPSKQPYKMFRRTICPGDEIASVCPSPPILVVYGFLHWVLILSVLCCWCVRAEQLPEASQDLVSGKTWERTNGTWQGTARHSWKAGHCSSGWNRKQGQKDLDGAQKVFYPLAFGNTGLQFFQPQISSPAQGQRSLGEGTALGLEWKNAPHTSRT